MLVGTLKIVILISLCNLAIAIAYRVLQDHAQKLDDVGMAELTHNDSFLEELDLLFFSHFSMQ